MSPWPCAALCKHKRCDIFASSRHIGCWPPPKRESWDITAVLGYYHMSHMASTAAPVSHASM